MLSLLTPRQSDSVGGPIGSLREAKKVESYLAKRLGAANPTAVLTNRYDTTRAGLNGVVNELVYKQNAVKGYEAEAEECLKKEFKDWLEGKHMDNLVPHTHNNAAGGGVRRDMHGQVVNNWVPTWWGPNQLTYLPGVREYLREQAIRADKNSLDLNVLAHLGPQNLDEAWAYFKHWVKGRPVGPEECLNPSPLDPSNTNLPNRAGPIHMQHDTRLHPDRPYNATTGLPPWPGGGGGGGGFFGGPPGPPPPGPPPDDDDDDDWLGTMVRQNVTPEGMQRGRAGDGRDYFYAPSGSEWAAVNEAADRALLEVDTLDVEGQIREIVSTRELQMRDLGTLATPRKLLTTTPGSRYDSAIVPARSGPGKMLRLPRTQLPRSPTPDSVASSVSDGYATYDEGYATYDENYGDSDDVTMQQLRLTSTGERLTPMPVRQLRLTSTGERPETPATRNLNRYSEGGAALDDLDVWPDLADAPIPMQSLTSVRAEAAAAAARTEAAAAWSGAGARVQEAAARARESQSRARVLNERMEQMGQGVQAGVKRAQQLLLGTGSGDRRKRRPVVMV